MCTSDEPTSRGFEECWEKRSAIDDARSPLKEVPFSTRRDWSCDHVLQAPQLDRNADYHYVQVFKTHREFETVASHLPWGLDFHIKCIYV